jgi:hypothetical protein
MTERRETEVTISDGEIPPDKLGEAIAWFSLKLSEVPPQYRDSAKLHIDTTTDWGGEANLDIRIFYSRPETDREMHDRVSQTAMQDAFQREREIQTLRALKAKYGDAV